MTLDERGRVRQAQQVEALWPRAERGDSLLKGRR